MALMGRSFLPEFLSRVSLQGDDGQARLIVSG
jgi:hypothetical protein